MLLFIDIDKFKMINDTYGHIFGNLLLKKFSSRLKKIIRSTDIVGRIGGDEFLVLINNISNLEFGKKIIKKLITMMRKPFKIEHKNVSITISIGGAYFPITATRKGQLLRESNMAMHTKKLNHGDGFHIL